LRSRRHTLLPLDDCLYALQATIPASDPILADRCLQRHGISACRRSRATDRTSASSRHTRIGYFHIDIAEVRTRRGQALSVRPIDRTSKFAFVRAAREGRSAYRVRFLEALIAAAPYRLHTVLTDNGIQFADLPRNRDGWTAPEYRVHRFDRSAGPNSIGAPPD